MTSIAIPSSGDVHVSPGTYSPLDLYRKLALAADPGAIIDAAGGKYAMQVHSGAAGSQIKGLATRNSTLDSNSFGAGYAILEGATDVLLDTVSAADVIVAVRSYKSDRATIRNLFANRVGVGFMANQSGGHTIDGGSITPTLMVVNDSAQGNDNGANALQFIGCQGKALSSVRNLKVYIARAPSIDYGDDGGVFEIFGSSHLLFEDNESWGAVNASETGTNSAYGDCVDITYRRNIWHGRDGTDHTENKLITCNGILGRNLQQSLIELCVFDRLDWWCFDFTQGSSYSGGGTKNVEVRQNQFILRDGDDKIYAFGGALPAGFSSHDNVIVANPSATLAVLGGKKYPASQDGFSAWKQATNLESGTVLYTPQEWAAHNAPPAPPIPVPAPTPVPTPAPAPTPDPLPSALPKFEEMVTALVASMNARLPSTNPANRPMRNQLSQFIRYARATITDLENPPA